MIRLFWCEKRDLEPLHKPEAWRRIQVRPPYQSRKEPMENPSALEKGEARDLEPLHKPAAWRQIQARPPYRSRKEPMENPSALFWCEKRDLNPYGVNHTPLKRARLPVPPLSHIKHLYFLTRSRSPRRKRCKPHAPQTCAFAKLRFAFRVASQPRSAKCYALEVPPSLQRQPSHIKHLYFLTRSRSPRSIISSNCRRFCDNISIIQQNFHFVNPFFKFFYFYYFCLNSSTLPTSLLCQFLKNS